MTRVWADTDGRVDRFAGLRRIGIDEISYKRDHQYLTVVVDHDSRPAGVGRARAATPPPCAGSSTLLGGRSAARRSPTCRPTPRTGSPTWSPNAARTRCAARTRSTWWPGPPRRSTQVRRQAWNDARAIARDEPKRGRGRPAQGRPAAAGQRAGPAAQGRPLRAVEEPRGPHRPPERQAGLDRQDRPPAAPGLPAQRGTAARVRGQGRRRQGGPGPVALLGPALPHPGLRRARPLASRKHRAAIDAALDHGLSNALIESTNTKIRLLHPDRVRLPLRRRTHRPGHARPRRLPTTHSPAAPDPTPLTPSPPLPPEQDAPGVVDVKDLRPLRGRPAADP